MLEAQVRASPCRSPPHERLAGRAHTSPIVRGAPGIALAIFSSWRQAAGSRLPVAYKISGKARATEILSGEPAQEALTDWTKALGAGRTGYDARAARQTILHLSAAPFSEFGGGIRSC